MKQNVNKSTIEDLYVKKQIKIKEISQIMNCSETLIYKKLKEYNISCRRWRKYLLTREFLIENYIVLNKDIEIIANEVGCSYDTIIHNLHVNQIELRKKSNLIDLTGKKIGRLSVLSRAENKKTTIYWNCVCECGKEKKINGEFLLKAFKNNRDASCGRCKRFEEIRGTFWNRIKTGAKVRNLEFSITIQYAWDLFLKQNRKCALSGLPLKFAETHQDHLHGNQTASLDRIDSSKGYIESNIQWLHKDINLMKSNYRDEEFIELCKKVAENNTKELK